MATREEIIAAAQVSAQKTHRINYEKRVAEYEKNPKRCEVCSEKIPYKKRENRFCNPSCAAKCTNYNFPKRKALDHFCAVCQKQIFVRKQKYCSDECSSSFKTNKPFDARSYKQKREKVFEEQNHSCNKCKNSLWNGQSIPLELEHIDGNRSNNKRENLEGICPNCHAQTPTYKGKNIKNFFTDEQIIDSLLTSKSAYQAMVKIGMSPQRNCYTRIRRIIETHKLSLPYTV